MTLPFLIMAIGNESRGDDGLAPLLVRQLKVKVISDQIEVIEDFQLQVEHVIDLLGRTAVLFFDADISCEVPFNFSEIAAKHDSSYTSHAMTPFALLYAFKQVYGMDAPTSYLMRVRGCSFELGDNLSTEATVNLKSALEFVSTWLPEILVSANS